MWKEEYCKAAVEVLDILKHTRKEDVDKIPKKFIDLLEQNASKNYVANLDHSKSVEDMNLRQETKELLGTIYRKWWATEEEKKEIYREMLENRKAKQHELSKKFDYDSLYKKNNYTEEKKFETSLTEKIDTTTNLKQKNGFFINLINKIKNILKKESD